jgi:hypothetical protein
MTDYEKSNKIESVDYSRLSNKEYKVLLNDSLSRVSSGQGLLDYLCDKYGINRIPLYVMNSPRKCNSRGCQTLGWYKYNINSGKGQCIIIYNLTAKTKVEVSIKRFVETLLHEFMHHYDTEYLKIKTTHTCGFYKRITDLKNKLEKTINKI